MNEKAFGNIEYCLECLIEAAAQLNSQEAGRDIAAARTELANARKLLEAADSFLTWVTDMEYLLPVEKLQLLEAAIAACQCGEKPECLS